MVIANKDSDQISRRENHSNWLCFYNFNSVTLQEQVSRDLNSTRRSKLIRAHPRNSPSDGHLSLVEILQLNVRQNRFQSGSST